jgi:hypothetical protein
MKEQLVPGVSKALKKTSGFHVRTSKEPQFSGQFFHYFFGLFWRMAGIYVYTTEPGSLIFLSTVIMKEITVLMHFHAFHVLHDIKDYFVGLCKALA